MKWTNERVVVTGASRGIGRAVAEGLAKQGARVVLAARSRTELDAVAAAIGERAETVTLDVTDDASVAAAAQTILAGGPVDVLINNAGVFHQQPFLAQPVAVQRHELEVNYFGAQRVTRALLPAMIARRAGLIVNVSSMVGIIPCPTVANYSASKAALEAWTHALRGEVKQHGVHAMVFRPSHTDTERARALTFDGVPLMTLDYTVAQLLNGMRKRPRAYTVSPVFRFFVRLAGLFPGWADRQMAKSTVKLLS